MTSLETPINQILASIDHLIEELEDVELTDEQGKALVDFEQQIHEKLAVIFDKNDVVVGDERVD
jgi:molecular chaperone GrpE (heat shock protein)